MSDYENNLNEESMEEIMDEEYLFEEDPEIQIEEIEYDPYKEALANDPEFVTGFQQQQHIGLIDVAYGTGGAEGLDLGKGFQKIRYAEIPREKLYMRDLYHDLQNVFSDPETITMYMQLIEKGIPRFYTKNPYVLSMALELLQFNDKITPELLEYKSQKTRISKQDLLRYIFLVEKHLGFDKTGKKEKKSPITQQTKQAIPKKNVITIVQKPIQEMTPEEIEKEFNALMKKKNLNNKVMQRYNELANAMIHFQIPFSLIPVFQTGNHRLIEFWIGYPYRTIFLDEIFYIQDRVLFRKALERFYVEYIGNLGKDADIEGFIRQQIDNSKISDDMKQEKMVIINNLLHNTTKDKKWVKLMKDKNPTFMNNVDWNKVI